MTTHSGQSCPSSWADGDIVGCVLTSHTFAVCRVVILGDRFTKLGSSIRRSILIHELHRQCVLLQQQTQLGCSKSACLKDGVTHALKVDGLEPFRASRYIACLRRTLSCIDDSRISIGPTSAGTDRFKVPRLAHSGSLNDQPLAAALSLA